MAKNWFVVDSTNLIIGRLASLVVKILTQKKNYLKESRNNYNNGIILINIEKIRFSLNKKKIYYRHSGYPGGLKIKSSKFMDKKTLFLYVIKNMFSKNKLKKYFLKSLIIYSNKNKFNIENLFYLNVKDV